MEYVISIFLLGLMVTLLVVKGIVQAHEFARMELERQDAVEPGVESPRNGHTVRRYSSQLSELRKRG